ncbi:hypothetical protein [Deinococcus misasensis]|nr:hypothetical protein [Deinococcus misasensis]
MAHGLLGPAALPRVGLVAGSTMHQLQGSLVCSGRIMQTEQ